MSVIILLLVASISIAGLFLFAFIWNVKTGQYDDETAPAMRILFVDKRPDSKEKQVTSTRSDQTISSKFSNN
jgi:cbb3-type cytochrome oxidase maturation protein